LIGAAALGSLLPATAVRADLARCDKGVLSTNGLSTIDSIKMRPLAIKTLQGHIVNWHTLRSCTGKHGGALANVDAVDEPQPDGTVNSFAATCDGDSQGWECDLATGRHLKMTVTVEGKDRALSTMIPDDVDLAIARKVMQQAIDVAPKLETTQVCNYDPTSTEKDTWIPSSLAEIHQDFKLPWTEPFASIDGDLHELRVEVGRNYLSFVPLKPGSHEYRFECWYFLLIMQ
jgi:hypothetical protein